jgi:cyclin H
MTYHPKQMTPSALFLSTKTENHYISLKSFVSKLPKTTADDVVAPEFLLTQGLRFTFEVRHPQRGLEGGFMELLAISTGTHQSPQASQESAKSLQQEMLGLEPVKGHAKAKSPADIKTRIQIAHGKAKDLLKTSALLTDVYLLYTPSQIWLAAFTMADEPLARFYLRSKFPKPDDVPPQLISTVEGCVELLRASPSVKPEGAEAAELARIHKKLHRCRNPEKTDLVGINQAQKRDGEAKGEAALDEKIVKKRKLEREQSLKDAESVFGPELAK